MTVNKSGDILTRACILPCSNEGKHMSPQACSSFILNILFILFLKMPEYLFVCIYTMCVAGSTKYVGSPVNRIPGSSEMEHGCKELHSGPLQKQQVLITTESPF